jgi:hypothetical protein
VENATFSIYAHTSNANTNLEGMAGRLAALAAKGLDYASLARSK